MFARLLILLAVAAPAWAELPEKAQIAMDKGLQAARAKDLVQAIRHFEDARAAAPESPEILANLALAEGGIPGRELRAIVWFGAYLSANPGAARAATVRGEIEHFRQFKLDDRWARPVELAEIAASKGREPARAALAALAASGWDRALLNFNVARLNDPANDALRRSLELVRWTVAQRRRLDEAIGKLDETENARVLLSRNLIPLFQELLQLREAAEEPAATGQSAAEPVTAESDLRALLTAARRSMATYFASQATDHMKFGDLPTAIEFFDLAALHAPESLRYEIAADKIREWIARLDGLFEAEPVRAEIAVLRARNRETFARLIGVYHETARRAQQKCVELKLFFLWVGLGESERAMEAADGMTAACHADGGGWGPLPRSTMERILLEKRLENGDISGARRQVEQMSGPRPWAEVEIEMAVARSSARSGDFAVVYRTVDALLFRYPGHREAIEKHMQQIQRIKAQLLDPHGARANPTLCDWDCRKVADWTKLVAAKGSVFGDIPGQLANLAGGRSVHTLSFFKLLDEAIGWSNVVEKMVEAQAELDSPQQTEAAAALRRYIAENPAASAAYDERYKSRQ